MRRIRRRLDLRAKIILVLVAVILPTFLIVTLAQIKFTQPVLEEEIRQVGVTSAKNLAAEIVGNRWLHLPNPTPRIESHIQEILYSQPNIVRIDVVAKDPLSGIVRLVASNVEEDATSPQPVFPLVEAVTTDYKTDEAGTGLYEIYVPIEQKARDPRAPRRWVGTVHLVISLKLVGRLMGALGRATATAAGFSVITLLVVLSYLLRKMIANDRLLRQAETQNLQLTEQLHDAQRQLMNTEKLAVMGQLTAQFAHEIGSPLNAIGGHLQLLQEDLKTGPSGAMHSERLSIIEGQLAKIEEIVKGFLQSTAKPPSQRQLADVNQLIDRTLGILKPRTDGSGVEIRRNYNREMGPLRIVPVDLEQILLNLLNNSLDSLRSRSEKRGWGDALLLEVSTDLVNSGGKDWAEVSVYDTGEGIAKVDLEKVLKPFFTTKGPGEGTGLGLPICQQLVHKYGGHMEIDSKEGAWTRVSFSIPYHSQV